MPFVDLQSRLGINVDRWVLLQSGQQPNKRPARCHAFEKDWIECSHGIGQTRAKKECQVEFEDFYECMHRQKLVSVEEVLKNIMVVCVIQVFTHYVALKMEYAKYFIIELQPHSQGDKSLSFILLFGNKALLEQE